MHKRPRIVSSAWYAYAFAGAILATACAPSRTVQEQGPGGAPAPTATGVSGAPSATAAGGTEMQRIYRSMGLIAGAGTLSFVASVSFFTAPSPDTTLVLLALSLPSRSLAFTREGDRYSAEYSVHVEARRGAAMVKEVDAKEVVRVPTFREISRTDESVIWQQYVRLAPGRYSLQISLKDEVALRAAGEEVTVEVPRLTAGALGTPIAVYEAIPRSSVDSLPRLLARPRSTATFGADSVVPVYLEATGPEAPSTVEVRALGDGDQELWKSSFELIQRQSVRSTTILVPVLRLGIGVSTISVSAPNRPDTARTRLLVSLGDDLPIASFGEMLNYLRWFAPADRIKTLRDAPPETRNEVWAGFLKSTDPVPNTPENEALRDYFLRIRAANQRFREDAAIGWQSDRGTAFVALGEPDQVHDSSLQDPNQRVRQLVWVYAAHRLQLVFTDQSGFGRWRLSNSGRAELETAIRRKLATPP
jgi:GWxTD domain-containing protein